MDSKDGVSKIHNEINVVELKEQFCLALNQFVYVGNISEDNYPGWPADFMY